MILLSSISIEKLDRMVKEWGSGYVIPYDRQKRSVTCCLKFSGAHKIRNFIQKSLKSSKNEIELRITSKSFFRISTF